MTIIITNQDAGVLPANIGTNGEFLPTTAPTTGANFISLIGDVVGTGSTTIQTAIATNAVTYPKMQSESASTLLGNPTGSAASPSEIVLGNGLVFSGSTLIAEPQGGFLNKFRNGTMDIWQRGLAGNYAIGPDGWYVSSTVASGSCTFDATTASTAPGNNSAHAFTLSNGNLTATFSSGSINTTITAGFGLSAGKWYWETTLVSSGGNGNLTGIIASGDSIATNLGATANGYAFDNTGTFNNNGGAAAYGSTFTASDIIGIAYDATNGNLWFSKNGTWQNSATLAEIAAGTTTHAAVTGLSGTFYPAVGTAINTVAWTANFGASAFTYNAPQGFNAPSGATWQQTTGRKLTVNSLQINGGSLALSDCYTKQRIESYVAAPLTSQAITVQAQIYNGTGSAIVPTLTVKHASAPDNWSSSITDINAVSFQSCSNGVWTRIVYTFTDAGFAANGLEITIDFGSSISSNTTFVSITEIDVRATPGVSTGLNSNPPQPELRSIEMSFCQRYYEQKTAVKYWGYCGSSGSFGAAPVIFQTSKRATPSMTTVTVPAYGNCSAFVWGSSSIDSVTWAVTTGTSGAFSITNLIWSANAEL